MNKSRTAGLILVAPVALVAAWLVLRSCTREEPPATPAAPPAREAFHASKPLRVHVRLPAQTDQSGDLAWLQYELRHVLNRGQMRVAPATPVDIEGAFTLQVDMSDDGKQATLALVAPDEVVERRLTVSFTDPSRLHVMQALAAALPKFLEAAHAGVDWRALIGTEDAKTYDTFVTSSMELLGPAGQGFTEPPGSQRTHAVERLESLTRAQPKFARAVATLATGYLSLGGQDESSLAQLAESSARRALALDDQLPDAHAAAGLVHLRRNEWVAAHEKFDSALTLDASNAAALEGLACLLTDAGRYAAALPVAEHAVLVQPHNTGAQQCLAYARTASNDSPAAGNRAQALDQILAGDLEAARRTLTGSLSKEELNLWAEPLLRAAGNRREIPDALQAITRAANDGSIDADTEILCGVALRQRDFVFNRISRLQRQREHVPLRILWLPRAQFLRRSARFEKIIVAADLPAFWQEHGVPDICGTEPAVYGCKLASLPTKSKE